MFWNRKPLYSSESKPEVPLWTERRMPSNLDSFGVTCPLCGATPRRACRNMATGGPLTDSIHPVRGEEAYRKALRV